MTASTSTTVPVADLFAAVERLLVSCAARDVDALADLFDLTGPRVLGLVSRVVGPGAVAEEVTVHLYEAIWRGEEVAHPRASLPWLLHVAHRRAVEQGRSQVPAQRRRPRASTQRPFPPERGWMPGLDLDEREALSEVYLRGRTAVQADQRLGWEEGTSVLTLHRAMLHLARLHGGAAVAGPEDEVVSAVSA